jgi:hypothetical protein
MTPTPDILEITGNGPTVIITPLAVGQGIIYISHPSIMTTYSITVKVTNDGQLISLNKTAITMQVGDEEDILAQIQNGTQTDYNNITWSTLPANSNLVTILGSGQAVKILAIADGSVTIVATTAVGTQASCQIIINKKQALIVSSEYLTMIPGDTQTITYTVFPENDGIIWTLSDLDAVDMNINTDTREITITSIKEGSITLTGRTDSGKMKTVKIDSWYPDITVDYSSQITGGTNINNFTKKNTYLRLDSNQLRVADRVRFQIDLSFPQPGLQITKINWIQSGFIDKLSLSKYNEGSRISLYYEPDWTLFDEVWDSGTLTVEITYSNGKLYSRTFNVSVLAQSM